MMIELLKENDPKLLEIAEDWDFAIDGDPSDIVKDMVTIMTKQQGIGLAAPQCGINKRIFIMGNFTDLVVCVNPKIISLEEDTNIDVEGCLSFPDLWLKVKRHTGCIVTYQTLTGTLIEEELFGLKARVFQHEFDHTWGITFDQRVGDLAMKMAKEKRVKDLKKKERRHVHSAECNHAH